MRRKDQCALGTALYRLKTSSTRVVMILALMAEGVDGSALERVFGYREETQRTWLTRAGMQAGKVHRHFFRHLSLHHIQLDELWVNARQGSCFPDNIAGGHRPWQLGLPRTGGLCSNCFLFHFPDRENENLPR